MKLNNFKLLITIGLNYNKLKIHSDFLSRNNIPAIPEEKSDYLVVATKRKCIPKFGIGLDWMLTSHFGIRGDASIEKTNNMNMYFNIALSGTNTYIAKPKISNVYKVLFYFKL